MYMCMCNKEVKYNILDCQCEVMQKLINLLIINLI